MKLTQAEYDALPEQLKGLYVLKGDHFEPTFFTPEQVAQSEKGLKDKNAELLGKLKLTKEQTEEAERQRQAELEEAHRKAGNLEAIDASWQKKMNELIESHKAELADRDGFINQTLVDAKANELATALGGKSAALFLPHIKPRLTVEKGQDGKFNTRILDADGKPSALTFDDLTKEFRSNEAFAAALVDQGSSGLGGGLRGGGKLNEQKPTNPGMGMIGNDSMLAEAMKLAEQ